MNDNSLEFFKGKAYRDRVCDYYNKNLKTHGDDVKSLFWGSRESQFARFSALTEFLELDDESVLDVGCGFADLYAYIRELYPNVRYSGVDINPNMIERAQKVFPALDVSVANILEEGYNHPFDYVVTSGVFTEEQSPWIPFVEGMLKRMYELANVAMAFNMMSIWSAQPFRVETPSDVNYDPVHWLDFCRTNLSQKLLFRHDYLPHDFTIVVYK